MQKLSKYLLTLVFTVVSGLNARADFIQVSQESSAGAGNFSSNVLGCIEIFRVNNTLANYYSYDIPNNVSYGNNPPSLVLNRSHLFLVQGNDGLGLFIVHDKPQAGPNGGGSANMDYLLVGDTASFLVRDDPNDTYNTSGGGTIFNTDHDWVSPNTDGTVIGYLNGNWSMYVDFNSWGGSNSLNSWYANSADGNDLALTLQADRRILLEYCVDVPVPAGLQLAMVGVGLLLAYRLLGLRRQASLS